MKNFGRHDTPKDDYIVNDAAKAIIEAATKKLGNAPPKPQVSEMKTPCTAVVDAFSEPNTKGQVFASPSLTLSTPGCSSSSTRSNAANQSQLLIDLDPQELDAHFGSLFTSTPSANENQNRCQATQPDIRQDTFCLDPKLTSFSSEAIPSPYHNPSSKISDTTYLLDMSSLSITTNTEPSTTSEEDSGCDNSEVQVDVHSPLINNSVSQRSEKTLSDDDSGLTNTSISPCTSASLTQGSSMESQSSGVDASFSDESQNLPHDSHEVDSKQFQQAQDSKQLVANLLGENQEDEIDEVRQWAEASIAHLEAGNAEKVFTPKKLPSKSPQVFDFGRWTEYLQMGSPEKAVRREAKSNQDTVLNQKSRPTARQLTFDSPERTYRPSFSDAYDEELEGKSISPRGKIHFPMHIFTRAGGKTLMLVTAIWDELRAPLSTDLVWK